LAAGCAPLQLSKISEKMSEVLRNGMRGILVALGANCQWQLSLAPADRQRIAQTVTLRPHELTRGKD